MRETTESRVAERSAGFTPSSVLCSFCSSGARRTVPHTPAFYRAIRNFAGSLHAFAPVGHENGTMALHIRVLPAVIVLSASALLLTACVQAEPDPTGPTTSPNPTRTIAPSN